jgi:type IV secretion system protein VirB4
MILEIWPMADRATLMSRENEGHEFIPYGRHIDAHTITVGSQSLMTMVEIDVFAFETADSRDLNGLQARLNSLLRNIADPRLALYALMIRRRVQPYPDGTSVIARCATRAMAANGMDRLLPQAAG